MRVRPSVDDKRRGRSRCRYTYSEGRAWTAQWPGWGGEEQRGVDDGDCRDAAGGEDAGWVAAIEALRCRERDAGRNSSMGCGKVRGWFYTYSIIEHAHCSATCKIPNTAPRACAPRSSPLSTSTIAGLLSVGRARAVSRSVFAS